MHSTTQSSIRQGIYDMPNVLCSYSRGFTCIICSLVILKCVLCMQTVHRAMLPVLLKLLHMPAVLDTAPQVLTDLLQQSPAMQKAAMDSDAVSSLTTLLHHEQTWHNRPCFKASLSLCCQPQHQHLFAHTAVKSVIITILQHSFSSERLRCKEGLHLKFTELLHKSCMSLKHAQTSHVLETCTNFTCP